MIGGERQCDGDDSIVGTRGGDDSGAWRQTNPYPVSSVLSCEEDEGERRHNGGELCMPSAVASCSRVNQGGAGARITFARPVTQNPKLSVGWLDLRLSPAKVGSRYGKKE